MGSARPRPLLFDRDIRLQLQNFLDNLVDNGGFGSQVPLGLVAGNPEPSGQEKHDGAPYFGLIRCRQ
jgi:hypothetical protein